MLLRQGVSYGTFSDLAKWVFADVAKKEFGIPGKKVSNSRISVITGITRHDVKKTLDMEEPEEFATQEKHNRAISIVRGWSNDELFSQQGQPQELSFDGEESSFTSLVKRYGGDITVRSVFDELLRAGAVKQLEGGKLRLVRDIYMPIQDLDQNYGILGTDVADLIATIDHNIQHPGKSDYLQLKASAIHLPEERAKIIRNEAKKRGLAFLREIDDWLAEEEKTSVGGKGKKVYLGGIGVYYFEERN